jgi:hypothetical protein
MLVKLTAATHVWSLGKKRTAVAAADVATISVVQSAARPKMDRYLQEDETKL